MMLGPDPYTADGLFAEQLMVSVSLYNVSFVPHLLSELKRLSPPVCGLREEGRDGLGQLILREADMYW